MKINQKWLRTMGFSGILGGLILFAGDMLFYYHPSSTNLKLNMGNVSDFRIIASGISALIATWLYLFALGQVYFAFKYSTTKIKNLVVLSFGSILVAYGIVHAAYIAIAVTSKLSVAYHLDIEAVTALASKSNQMLRWVIYPIFIFLSYLFFAQVLKRKTLYPRWILLFFPLIPFLFQGWISDLLSGKLWVIIVGGYLNLILVLFFSASTIALWNIKEKGSSLE